ncbi:hypothetical protein Dimus_020290 [Dionaea muscipula]
MSGKYPMSASPRLDSWLTVCHAMKSHVPTHSELLTFYICVKLQLQTSSLIFYASSCHVWLFHQRSYRLLYHHEACPCTRKLSSSSRRRNFTSAYTNNEASKLTSKESTSAAAPPFEDLFSTMKTSSQGRFNHHQI